MELLDRCPLEYGAGFRGHRPPGSSTLGAYIWFFRRQLRFPQAWLLLPLGAGVIWLANVVRIFALVIVGTWTSAPGDRGRGDDQRRLLGRRLGPLLPGPTEIPEAS